MNVESCAGNAWVSLKLNLGNAPPRNIEERQQKRASPSRIRWREKRASAFSQHNMDSKVGVQKKNVRNTSEENTMESGISTERLAFAKEANVVESVATEEVATSSEKVYTDEVIRDDKVAECKVKTVTVTENEAVEINAGEVDTNVAQGTVGTDTENVATENDVVALDIHIEKDEVDTVASKDVCADESEKILDRGEQSACVTLNATAVIENSPYGSFCQDEWESILRFATDKDHLKRNIENFKYCHSTTKRLQDAFVHSVNLEIQVRTTSLWETPRSYLFKHVGQDSWERGNGSTIRLTKIHQK